MNLGLRAKVFLGLFTLASVMILIAGYIFYFFQIKAIKKDFENHHDSIAQIISNNLRQAENLTDQLMLNTAYGLEEIINHKVPSKDYLRTLRDRYKVTDLYLINANGKFVESTDNFAQTTSFNFFSFCPDYKKLVDKSFAIDQTPILLAHPPNNDKPYKFTHLTTRNKNYIIEVGIHLKYIQEILKASLQNNKSINGVTLKTPSGQILGEFKTNRSSGEVLTISKIVKSNDSNCCQCKIKKLTDDKYYYNLVFEISMSDMNLELHKILRLISILEVVFILFCLLMSHFISKSILRKFEELTSSLDKISVTGDLIYNPRNEDKDINSITESFNRMMKKLIEKENSLVENEKLKTRYNLSNQVAHDIRSPLGVLKSLKDEMAYFPDLSRKRMLSSINRIEEITYNLLKTNRNYPATDEGFKSEDLVGLLSSIVAEKKIEFRNSHFVTIVEVYDSGSYGLFSKLQSVKFKNIISNFINNSIESLAGAVGRVEIYLKSQDETNEVIVKDNGAGIPFEFQDKLFEKGFTTKVEGNGLGVFNSRKDVESFGGRIHFESKPGIGTEFKIVLPKSDRSFLFVNSIDVFKYEKIIILDDDLSFHEVWADRFKDFSSIVEHFYSIEGILLKYKELPESSLFLSDFELMDDDMDGIDLILKFAHQENSILVTARSEESDISDRCLHSGLKLLPKFLVGHVPIIKETPLVVLIDNDKFIHASWKEWCKKKNYELLCFKTVSEFIEVSMKVSEDARIYIDSDLGNGIRGEVESKKIYNKGFRYIFLSTGYEKTSIVKPFWINDIYSKDPRKIL